MNVLAKLDQLDLNPVAKTEVAALIQALLDQSERDAKAIQAKDLKIEALTHELAHIRRIRYGVKSETLSPLQRDVFEETWNTDLSAIEAEVEHLQDNQPCDTVAKPKRPRAGRQPLPAHLPRIEHHHEPESCSCGNCGNDLVKIREDISEQLDVEPAKFFVHRHIRPQYACKNCETITAAPIPPAVIDGGLAAVGLLAWVMVSKYQDHLPLYRLEQIAARDQVILSRSTLAEWVGRVGVALQPLVERLTWQLLQGNTLHADESVPRRRTGGENPLVQLCCTRDEGRPLEVAVQAEASNRLLPLRLRDAVVSEIGKGQSRIGQVGFVKSNASEPLMTCRNVETMSKLRGFRYRRTSPGGACLRPGRHPAWRWRECEPGSCVERGNLSLRC